MNEGMKGKERKSAKNKTFITQGKNNIGIGIGFVQKAKSILILILILATWRDVTPMYFWY